MHITKKKKKKEKKKNDVRVAQEKEKKKKWKRIIPFIQVTVFTKMPPCIVNA